MRSLLTCNHKPLSTCFSILAPYGRQENKSHCFTFISPCWGWGMKGLSFPPGEGELGGERVSHLVCRGFCWQGLQSCCRWTAPAPHPLQPPLPFLHELFPREKLIKHQLSSPLLWFSCSLEHTLFHFIVSTLFAAPKPPMSCHVVSHPFCTSKFTQDAA